MPRKDRKCCDRPKAIKHGKAPKKLTILKSVSVAAHQKWVTSESLSSGTPRIYVCSSLTPGRGFRRPLPPFRFRGVSGEILLFYLPKLASLRSETSRIYRQERQYI